MDISFIILTWNSEKFIKNCLNSIIDEMSSGAFCYEIIIVDNGSNDSTVQILKKFKKKYPKLLANIFLQLNTGTTYSRNIALKKARGKILVVLDSDVEIGKGAIYQLVKFLKSNEKAGLVVPKLVYSDGSIQKSTDDFPTIFSKIYRFFFLKHLEKNEFKRKLFKGVLEVDYAISAMWVLKSEILETVGFLDEKIFYSPEDVDYCLRIWLAGYKIYYYLDVSIIHHAQEISRGFRINKEKISHISGLLYYFKKHRYMIRKPIVR